MREKRAEEQGRRREEEQRTEEQRSRGEEEQRSRGAEEQRSRGAEEQGIRRNLRGLGRSHICVLICIHGSEGAGPNRVAEVG
jgi:hypothetical protein